MTKEQIEKELSGETNVMWKVINKHLTVEVQQYIRFFITSTRIKDLEEVLEPIEKEIAGLAGIIVSNIRDTGQCHIAEMKLANILSLLQTRLNELKS